MLVGGDNATAIVQRDFKQVLLSKLRSWRRLGNNYFPFRPRVNTAALKF